MPKPPVGRPFPNWIIFLNMVLGCIAALWQTLYFIILLFNEQTDKNRAAEFLAGFGLWYIVLIHYEVLAHRYAEDKEEEYSDE